MELESERLRVLESEAMSPAVPEDDGTPEAALRILQIDARLDLLETRLANKAVVSEIEKTKRRMTEYERKMLASYIVFLCVLIIITVGEKRMRKGKP